MAMSMTAASPGGRQEGRSFGPGFACLFLRESGSAEWLCDFPRVTHLLPGEQVYGQG